MEVTAKIIRKNASGKVFSPTLLITNPIPFMLLIPSYLYVEYELYCFIYINHSGVEPSFLVQWIKAVSV